MRDPPDPHDHDLNNCWSPKNELINTGKQTRE